MTDPAKDLRRLLETVENGSADFDDRIPAMLVELSAGETLIAFEDVCSNLYEFDVPLNPTDYDLIRSVADALGAPQEVWSFVRELVPPPET